MELYVHPEWTFVIIEKSWYIHKELLFLILFNF